MTPYGERAGNTRSLFRSDYVTRNVLAAQNNGALRKIIIVIVIIIIIIIIIIITIIIILLIIFFNDNKTLFNFENMYVIYRNI